MGVERINNHLISYNGYYLSINVDFRRNNNIR